MQKALRNTLIGAGALAAAITASVVLTTGPKVYTQGTGSGNLIVDGNQIGAKSGDTIKIKGGKYSSITIQNINPTGGVVTIIDSGLVELTGNGNYMTLANISNATITGTGTAGNNQGFSLHDANYRPMRWSGVFHNVQIDHFLFKNTGDYTISWDFTNTVYKDSSTAYSDIHILNCEFANIGGMINLDGGIQNNQVTGLINRLEIGYCNLHDASPGDFFSVEMAQDYNIHDNYGNNLNTTNNNDNGIFHIQGIGKFYNNFFTNIQGHCIRAWTVTVGTTPKTEAIYNNIVYNTRKYSLSEVQGFQNFLISGKTTYGNAIVYNNTAGNLNLSHDFVGGIVDVYGLFGGTCNVNNNLAFNTYPANSIANQEYTTVPVLSGNNYQATWKTAVKDTVNFVSLFKGVGASLNSSVIIPPPPPINTGGNTNTGSTSTTIHDTIRIHDTVSIAGKSVGTYTLTVSKDTLTLKKQ